MVTVKYTYYREQFSLQTSKRQGRKVRGFTRCSPKMSERRCILLDCHDKRTTGHLGINKTITWIRSFIGLSWTKLSEDTWRGASFVEKEKICSLDRERWCRLCIVGFQWIGWQLTQGVNCPWQIQGIGIFLWGLIIFLVGLNALLCRTWRSRQWPRS